MLLAGALGHDVEHRLKAAGFTDSASESERATTLLRDELGYDANPGIVLVVRDPDGVKLDRRDPALRQEVARLSDQFAGTRYVGRVINPLEAKGPAAAALIAEDGRSLVISGHLATQDIEDKGGVAAEDAKRRVSSETLAISMGGFAPGFNDVNDQTRKDLTNAELIAFPALTILLLLVFRGVIAAADPAADRRDLDPRHVPRAADHVRLRRHVAVRAQHHHGGQPRARRRLRAAARLPLSGGDPARRRDPRGPCENGDDGRSHGAVLRLHRRRGDGRARVPAAALPLLARRRRRRRGDPVGTDRRVRRAGAARPARHPHRHALDPSRPGRDRRLGRLVPARARRSCAVRSPSPWRARHCCWPPRRRCSGRS